MWGKELAKEVAPCTAPKWILPMQELGLVVSEVQVVFYARNLSYLSLKPKTARATFKVTCLEIRVTFL